LDSAAVLLILVPLYVTELRKRVWNTFKINESTEERKCNDVIAVSPRLPTLNLALFTLWALDLVTATDMRKHAFIEIRKLLLYKCPNNG
jgi:hypothetical protein